MWFTLSLISVSLIALVNYFDEKLTENNPAKDIDGKADKHTEVGGLILMSTLMSFVGAFVVLVVQGFSIEGETSGLMFAVASSIPFVILFASYFYLLRVFPVYMVIPLFQLSSVWLLITELIAGVSISIPQILAILVLLTGSYLLDVGKFEWKIPGKLLATMVPVSMAWALGLFFVKIASKNLEAPSVSFWQFLSIGIIGILLFVCVKKYRKGLLVRIKQQGKTFLGLSAINESLSQGSYYFGNLAIAAAPAATFVSALAGLQSLFIIIIFFIFSRKIALNKVQLFAIFLIISGVFLIERF